MDLFVGLIAGLFAGLVSGGRLSHLAALHLTYAWLPLLALAVQTPLVLLPPVLPAAGPEPLRFWLPATLIALAFFAWGNRRLPGMPLILLGLAGNAAAIFANGGLMPTHEAALRRAGMIDSLAHARGNPGVRLPRSKNVLLEVGETRLWWLSDVFVSPLASRPRVFSAGDVAITAGVFVLVASSCRAGGAKPLGPGAALAGEASGPLPAAGRR